VWGASWSQGVSDCLLCLDRLVPVWKGQGQCNREHCHVRVCIYGCVLCLSMSG
jgi:hypothetical protein